MKTKGKVTGIIANLVTVEVEGPVAQNEICYIDRGSTKLMAEVIKVIGKYAYVQVFESTRGLKVNDTVEFEGHMLEATLGPGLLSKNYDGLQHDLAKMDGIFLKAGDYTEALDYDVDWEFTPIAKVGDSVTAGDWIGEVPENWVNHKIMVPFKLKGNYSIKSIVDKGNYKINEIIAVITDNNGNDVNVTMEQKWPVKMAITAFKEKPRPFKIMETGVRAIDTFNPIAEGGTGFIPGPFGCGKTVLQHAISKQAEADLIVIAACGERANEVVEIFTEFPHLDDPRTGRKLMERTTIIANTSNMPVAAREALREMSNRLEELPGPDAFPMDLPAVIANFYSRAGLVYLNNGQTGSVTFIGTVSPAGGNLKEPVTESTKKAARCFYALSQQRADSKRYPAIDPMDSYSKYLEYPEIIEYLNKTIDENWVPKVLRAKNIVQRGKEAYEQINILGDDGVPLEYHDRFWKAELIDFIILQQDAFDKIDSSCPIKRQKYMLEKVISICDMSFSFENFEDCSKFYKNVINTLRQMNYSVFESDEFNKYEEEIDSILNERKAE